MPHQGFSPWAEQRALPPGAPQEAPPPTGSPREAPKPRSGKGWWSGLPLAQPLQMFSMAGMGEMARNWTMPWQQQHWENQPGWTRGAGKFGLGIGMAAGGLAAGMAAPGALFGAGRLVPWLSRLGLGLAGHPTATALAGGLGGLMASANIAPPEMGVPTPTPPGAPGEPPPTAVTPPGAPTAPVLPTPGEGAGVEPQPTFFDDEQGNRWVYNEFTGEWTMVQPQRTPGLTFEQQQEMVRQQFELEQQRMGGASGLRRGEQEAAAAQQMAQMFAQDPFKFWAQMGQGTPEAVARLTGGEIEAGEQFQQGVPLSMPSQQWWGNLLPSEQQQIMGGVNWLGIDPQDWMAMQRRMIPGLGARQMSPEWAR